MTYQYKREPLSVYEAYRLLNAAKTLQEKLCVWGLLETGLRVSSWPTSPETNSSLWIHKGGSTRALQSILGHDHLSTTEIYLNMSLSRCQRNFRGNGNYYILNYAQEGIN